MLGFFYAPEIIDVCVMCFICIKDKVLLCNV